ncbi:MAG TPA: DUF6178 family protein [Polyangia bacterium]|jgi:hypothetical protein|nr:DUF6178 family protein [Polyangia bacterium]
MPESKNVPPDNVIALSRYRAQLGRGKKLRRSEALMDSPNPEAAIRALPGDELYYVVHEAGPRDAMEILLYASAGQVQTVLDFAIWERDEVAPARLAEWLEVLAEAPPEKIGEWIAGMDVELVGLILTTTMTIYDLSEGEPPDEPQGTFYPTPDRLFVLDVRGLPGDGPSAGDEPVAANADDAEEQEGDSAAMDSARAVIQIIDNLYRSDRVLARRLLVAARGELPSGLQEMAYRWRSGRMADLGFADPWEALEVYRELDPATVRIGESTGATSRVRPSHGDGKNGDSLRAPLALVERLGNGSPFARAVAGLSSADQVAELHFALVALGNRVLSADRVTPGDDEAVAVVLGRMLATLDIAIEFLAHGDEERATEAVATVSVVRLFRLGVSLVGKVRRLARALERRGPFAALGPGLFEDTDAEVIAAVTHFRPAFPRILDDPPRTGERPFASMADVARATAAIKEAAAAQALLYGLGVRAEHISGDAVTTSAAGGETADAAAVDAGVLARTALVARLLASDSSLKRDPSMPFRPLSTDEVRQFEALTRAQGQNRDKDISPMKLSDKLTRKVKAILDALAPEALAEAARKVADRWVAGLVPLEPVLVRKPAPRPTRRRR